MYVISGTGESKGSNGFSFARRYSSRFNKLLKQDGRTHAKTDRPRSQTTREKIIENSYFSQWCANENSSGTVRQCTDHRSSRPPITKPSWLNRYFHETGSNESPANSISDDDSLSARLDSTLPCFTRSPGKEQSRLSRSIPESTGVVRLTPFQYGHHPLCNNFSSHNHVKTYPDSSVPTIIPNALTSKTNSATNNCSSCAKQLHEATSPRSPWVEPLRHGLSISESPDQTSSQYSDSRSACSSSSPTRIFRTTVTATAAAALAASQVLNNDKLLSKEATKLIGACKPEKTRNTHLANSLDPRRHYQNNPTDRILDENESANTMRLARAAVGAAFRAAAIMNNGKTNKHHFSTHSYRNRQSGSSDVKSKPETLYPYRKLAARLDCMEMMAYLLLSTINAIVCLLIMPRFTQDPLPPKHWIS